MYHHLHLAAVLVPLALGPLAAQVAPPQVTAPGDRVLRFEANRGQYAPDVAFVARGPGYSVSLRPDRVILGLRRDDRARAALTMRLVDADPTTALEGVEQLASVSHHYRGVDPEDWKVGVPHFARVVGRAVWPGIDVVYRGDGTRLEYDFVVAPGTDPGRIRLAFDGATGIGTAQDGSLRIDVGDRHVVQRAPVLFQNAPDGRRTVDGAFRVLPDRTVTFDLGRYDPDLPLWIDPVVVYATFFGAGSDAGIRAIAAAPDGSLFVAGGISAGALPQPTQGAPAGATDIALSRFDAAGNLLFSLYFGGSGAESAAGVAIDTGSWQQQNGAWTTGQVWLAGGTDSADLPVTANAYDGTFNGATDAWIAGFDLTGTCFYASYYGGPASDSCVDVACATDGSVYVAGRTGDPGATFPTTPGAFSGTNVTVFPEGADDAFVARFVPAGAGSADLAYATLIGSGESDFVVGLDVDAEGNAYIAANMLVRSSVSPLWPTTANAYRPSIRVRRNATLHSTVMSKIAPHGNGADDLVYSTFLFPYQDSERTTGIAADGFGRVYLCGLPGYDNLETTSGAFAEAPAYGTALRFNDSFVMVLDTRVAGSASLVYSTYLGGYFTDWPYAIATRGATVTEPGLVDVVGWTHWDTAPSDERNPVLPFPTTSDALRSVPELGGVDGFYARLRPAGDGAADLRYGTLLGGSAGDQGLQVCGAPGDRVQVAGTTSSPDFLAGNHPTGDFANNWIVAFEFASAPPTAPAAPTGLTATAVSTSGIDLGWVDEAGDETGFRIERSPDGSSWSLLVTLDGPDVTSYADTDLTAATTWSYRVLAFNDVGPSAWSDVATATTWSGGGGGGSEALADGEVAVSGSVIGSYTDTHAGDGTAQAITEIESGGKPSTRHSYLEHKWRFTVTPGAAVTFFVDAWRSASSDGDDFVLAWSADNVDYTDMLTVSATSDPGAEQSFALPANLGGTVWVRARDTDRDPGHRGLDTLFVDRMRIVSQ